MTEGMPAMSKKWDYPRLTEIYLVFLQKVIDENGYYGII